MIRELIGIVAFYLAIVGIAASLHWLLYLDKEELYTDLAYLSGILIGLICARWGEKC